MGRQSRLKKKIKQILPAVTVTLTTVAPFVVWSPTASAFFPPIWPVSPPVTVVPPTIPPVIVPPPVIPPVVVPPPVVPPIIVPPVCPPPVTATPEPATLISGLIGLAAAAGYGLKRRGQKKDEAKASDDAPKTE